MRAFFMKPANVREPTEAGKPAVVVSGRVGETLDVSGDPGGEA
jgi:hypothetical protein